MDSRQEPIVQVRGAGKRYIKYEDTPTLLGAAARFRSRNRRSALWAVRGIDLDVARGESIGIIGRNGSGKSTLLRMLAGVTGPTEGEVAVRGQVAPLISVGVGFHPELTGRENVYVNGTVLGLPRREIERRFDQIVAFAEIESFIDTPVKFYSSGMLVRLGFAVAVSSSPDLLLVDEVLAVGDIAFQVKCFERLREIQAGGATVLIVSHNLNAIRNLCPRVVVLHDGAKRFDGTTDDGLSVYHQLLEPKQDDGAGPAAPRLELLDEHRRPTAHVAGGDLVRWRLTVQLPEAATDPVFSISLTNEAGILVFAESTLGQATGRFAAGDTVVCEITFRAQLVTGSYTGRSGVRWGDGPDTQRASRPVEFFVGGRPLARGVVDLHPAFDVHAAPDDRSPRPGCTTP